MADLKISELPAAGALTGAELIETVQGGVNKQTTTQNIADLGGGGGGTVTSVTGTTNRITSTGGATPVIDIDAAYDTAVTNAINAKVADAINDGTTTIAPSQNAVFDALALKAPLASPTFTGTPAAPTAATTTNTTQIATTAFVQQEGALKQTLINSATALTDASSMDLTAIKHTLTTSSATRTFTISYTGDDITLIVTLNTTSTVFTFPATSLCVSEGVASGDNTCTISAVSGDKIAIAIKKVGSAYYVVSKNFGQ